MLINKDINKPVSAGRCEDCEFYDYDEEWEEYICSMSLQLNNTSYDR